MEKMLTPEQVALYCRHGFVYILSILTPAEVAEFLGELEAWERQRSTPSDFPKKSEFYLLFKWADQLVHHPKILDAAEDLIGPNVLVYHSTSFHKETRTLAYVRRHQNSVCFYLEPHLQVTAWLALSNATAQAAGCMRTLPASNRWGVFEHDDKPDPLNMIRRGQGISDRFDQETGTMMPVSASEISLHRADLVHSSGANDSDCRHIGFAITYIAAHILPAGDIIPSALRARSRDRAHPCRTRHSANTKPHWRCSVRAKMRTSIHRQPALHELRHGS